MTRRLRWRWLGAQTCVLVAIGPSLNKIRWDWQDNFDVIMGMNKIFLGLERYNITKVRPPCLPALSLRFLALSWLVCRVL